MSNQRDAVCLCVRKSACVCGSEFCSPQLDIPWKTWGHCKRSRHECSGLSAAFSSVLIFIRQIDGTMYESKFWHNCLMHVAPEMEEYTQLFHSIGTLQPSRLGYIELLQEEVKRNQDVSDQRCWISCSNFNALVLFAQLQLTISFKQGSLWTCFPIFTTISCFLFASCSELLSGLKLRKKPRMFLGLLQPTHSTAVPTHWWCPTPSLVH